MMNWGPEHGAEYQKNRTSNSSCPAVSVSQD